ncbi:MAG TPA: Asp-tRNA(Asn)/Glu-tRNA(Gln) amidotransferase subunit GatC [Gammaproteobacteria bacterium]|nr:Asp-tRNA(Asn)/Glu-tRNA(Gln) amidotransferase subunit GatC [Gammaproteobacteria bacterium]
MLDKTDVKRIAHLARLAIDEQDNNDYQRDLTNILSLVEKMSAVDTADVVPMAHPLEGTQRLRKDQVTEPDERDKLQAVAPRVEAGLYIVPKVIE